MWDNENWAQAHLAKRHPGISTKEAWETVFENKGIILVSPDQYRYPPFRRYWTIGHTNAGKKLLVVWEQWRGVRNLITAYPPSREQVRAYETKTQKIRRRPF
jgi:hypothetical protein